MRKYYLMVGISLVGLVGCSQNDAENTVNNAMQQGMDYIAMEEYEKAEAAFEIAMEEDSQETKASKILEELELLQKSSTALEEESYDEALEHSGDLKMSENGSQALVEKGEEIFQQGESAVASVNEEEKEETSDEDANDIETIEAEAPQEEEEDQSSLESEDSSEISEEETDHVNENEEEVDEYDITTDYSPEEAIKDLEEYTGIEDGQDNGDVYYSYDIEPIYNDLGIGWQIFIKSQAAGIVGNYAVMSNGEILDQWDY